MAAGPEDVSPSLEAVLRRFAGMLHHLGRAYGLTGADADELCQEVRIRLWHALGNRERIDGARASYVYRTALSAATDLIRRRRARPTEPLERHIEAASRDAVPPGGGETGSASSAADGPSDGPGAGALSATGGAGARAARGRGADDALADHDLAVRIDAAIARLHPPRDLVVRLHLSGYDRREIAALAGWTEAKTRNLLYRGLNDLREILHDMGIGPEGGP